MTATSPNETPLVEPVPVLGKRLLGLGKDASYAAAKAGLIPTIKIGRKLLGLTRVLEARLAQDPDTARRA
jgi:hypothetical protein